MTVSTARTNTEIKTSTAELFQMVSSRENGLSSTEASERLTKIGPNEIPEKQENAFLRFLSYFWGPIPWMIEVAAILSAAVRQWADFYIILILLLVNALVGFWEEFQAGNAIAALKAQLALKARVKREGQWTVIPTRELVPGDLIRLRMGDIVPADARLLAGDPIEVDQSALTGESLPVTRRTSEEVFSGSTMKLGEIEALVYATGKDTYFGKTAQLVETTHTVSHFQKAVLKIGDYLISVAVFLAIVILIVALWRHDPMVTTLEFALVLTVASIPVALPTVLSVTMAVGARLLARHKAIVSRLVAIEELAGIDILCSDKTGTLTENRLTIGEPFAVGISAEELMLYAALASRAENQDSIDEAVLSGLKDKTPLATYQTLHYLPFDPVHKRTEATIKGPDGVVWKASKGAPQAILALAANAAQVEAKVSHAIDLFAARGFRALGVARTDAQGQWQFLGVIPLYDPLRSDTKPVLDAARSMGVQVKMLTGDQMAIARETAYQLGLGDTILDATAFAGAGAPTDGVLAEVVEGTNGFAQVFPEHKFKIVQRLQERQHIVGMTGDGVNDAPALKQADVGIAVSGATDAARAAADIVLLSPGLSVIVEAIKEARVIFGRMKSYAIFRISETIRIILFIALSITVFNFYPVTAIMIVILALLNDIPIMAIAYDNAKSESMPVRWNMREVLTVASVLGFLGVCSSFLVFYILERLHFPRGLIQAILFLKLDVSGHSTIYVARTADRHFWHKPYPSLKLLIPALGTRIIGTLIACYGLFMTPVGWKYTGWIYLYATTWFLINDFVKVCVYKLLRRYGWIAEAR